MAAGVTTSTQPNGKRAVVFINRFPTADPLPQRYTVTIPARQDELPAFPRLLPPMPQRQSLQPKPQPRPLPVALDAEEVNPQTWRRIELLAWKADEETCDVVLLRPLWWIEQAGAKVGGLIRLAMPEMGVAGPAKVLSIGPCPRMQERKPGTQVVTGTFKHKAKMVLHLHLEGLDKPIGVTPNHPIYSLDRGDFIPAGNLRIGERLKTYTGVSAVVTRIEQVPGEQAVYNLEVHRDHVYYVSNLGVLVHNTYVNAANVNIPEHGLQKMFTKHGADFGLTGNWNSSRAAEMRAAIMAHLNNPSVKTIAGSYRGKPVTHVVDPSTGLNVIINPGSDFFIGGWKLSADQLASVLSSGRLF